MPTTPEGIEYEQLFALNSGQMAYSESFERDANSFTAYLACEWLDVPDFRREVMGYTVFDSANPYLFHRVPGMRCPYTQYAYAHRMTLINYGRVPDQDTVTDFDASVTAFGTTEGDASMAYYPDSEFDDWFSTHRGIFRVDYTKLPFPTVDDEKLLEYASATEGVELSRYVIRQRLNNVRELRHPDHNFKPEGEDLVLFVNGFIPSVEAEIIYTWFQVPFEKIQRTAINACRLKINDDLWDDSWVFPFDGSEPYQLPGHEENTMLFVDAKGIDLPYAGADGGLYADIQYIFRLKRNVDASNNVVGHNHFLNASGAWKKALRRSDPTKSVYETTDQFNNLFVPEP